MNLNRDEQYMLRCIELAQLGQGSVAPNPMVGCVIVQNDTIIGQGWHQQYGGAHAEINALQSIQYPNTAVGSTVYVNLEPCNHFGKTPPCSHALVKAGVSRVVVGMQDPFEQVAGKGIAHLQANGIKVEVGVLSNECLWLNRRFITYQTHKRPYIVLKWAQTQDGFIAPDASKLSAADFEQKRHITGLVVQLAVHKWRGIEDAILVGNRTILTDNPKLNTRAYPGKNPVRITFDSHHRITPQHHIADGSVRTLVFTNTLPHEPLANIEYCCLPTNPIEWKEVCKVLAEKGIQSVIVEGGTTTLNQIIASGIWDEAQVFTSPIELEEGIEAPLFKGAKRLFQKTIDSVDLTIYGNPLFTA